jgi:hypothetical protein
MVSNLLAWPRHVERAMNQAEIKVQKYSTTAAARLANLREKTKVSL